MPPKLVEMWVACHSTESFRLGFNLKEVNVSWGCHVVMVYGLVFNTPESTSTGYKDFCNMKNSINKGDAIAFLDTSIIL